ncbi:MAG: hypothetical protein MUF29_09025 [Chitinophagaceae bacterium]|nr:hypothetical protein [Chitinophagaceae bacterium]
MEKSRSSRRENIFWPQVGWASAILLMMLAAYAIHQISYGMFSHLQEELVAAQSVTLPR